MAWRDDVMDSLSSTRIRYYLAGQALVFWGLILVCWLIYPKENHHSIMTHTFSFLGSWEAKHNPRGWWLFSVAMVFWGASNVVPILYLRRQLEAISARAASMGALFFLAGSLGVALVGCFPDIGTALRPGLRWTDVHEKAAVLVAAGFGLGIPWHGVTLLKDAFAERALEGAFHFPYRRLLWPFLMWSAMVATAAYFQIRWALIYEARKALAQAQGQTIGSSWSESLGTIWGFPLWENLVIYTLYIFLAWLVVALPIEQDIRASRARAATGR